MRRSGDQSGPRSAAPRRPGATRALCAALALAVGACAERAPEAQWPAGALLVGRTAALRSLLDDLQQLDGTPLAAAARRLSDRLPDCESVEAHAPSGRLDDLVQALACRATPSALEAVHRRRGENHLLLALPVEGGSRAWIAARDTGDGISLALRWRDAPSEGVLALLLPGAEPTGPALLGGTERLVHVRVRPLGGLDLAALVPQESQANRLFRLRSELFAGVVLDGTWEAAVYLPEPDHAMPRAALALGFELRGPAVAALEQFIDQLTSMWPVQRSDFAFGAATGACLRDLNLLPELAPCYVATERALVIGWNAASLTPALAAEAVSAPVSARASGSAVIDFARFAQADASFARRLKTDLSAKSADLPWRRLVAHGGREAGELRAQIALERGAAP
jgi:hypothetical protein